MSFPFCTFSKCLTQIIPQVSISHGIRSFSVGTNNWGKSRGRGPPNKSKGQGPFDTSDQTTNPPQRFQNANQLDKSRTSSSPFGLPPLSQSDCERRVVFAEQVLTLLDKDPNIVNSIVFSDEGNFWPHSAKGLNPKKIKRSYNESEPIPTIVWCGMTTKEIIGPYFFNAYVTESSYLKMLRKYLLPQLTCLNYPLTSTWFQQDGAPPHRTSRVLSFLQSAFEERLISYGCPLAWPPRSQDLTPLDYFFWDYLKSKIAPFQPQSTQDLRECIAFEVKVVDPALLEKAINEWGHRLELCRQAQGARFTMNTKET